MSPDPWVLHVDLDQFIAAVEVLRHPELAGRPVIVGGSGVDGRVDVTARAVVATASYEARAFGVRSGMALRHAGRRCPDAVFLPTDAPAYEEASAQVMATLREFPVVVEELGADEAFLGADTRDPESLAHDVARAVRERTGLSCSVGIGDNTLRAKMATEFGKPAGVFRLTRHNWFALLGDRPTDALWGIGRKTARKLAALGIETVTQLAEYPPSALAAELGPAMGPYYVSVGRGLGRAEVVGTPRVARSRSRETTFGQNLRQWPRIRAEVAVLAGRVAADVLAEARPAARVAVKVRFAPFLTFTRSATLAAPTDDPAVIEAAALEVLERFEHDRPVRLLGVRAEFVSSMPS